tara:strand:- start:1516 stop:1812 length:297 start_codon:yes stop_codon:yes gene_type:complete
MYGIIAPDLLSWLVQQAPVVVVMGAAIYWLATKLNKAEGDKDSLAKDVIKLTTLWEAKGDKIEDRNEKMNDKHIIVNEQILDLLRDIKLIVSKYNEKN